MEPFQRKIFAVKVREIARPASDVAVIRLRMPIGRRAIFRAGQYLRVLMADGDSRNYSMANAPYRNDELELHIRHVAGGKFSESTLAALSPGSLINTELPYGEFRLSETDKNAILIATGTGFAPIKSLIEQNIRLGVERSLHLYWGANTQADLYMQELPRSWEQRHPWFRFTPVVSNPSKTWTGRTGFVHEAVLQDYPEMSEVEVYACGAPIMIEAAKREFTAIAKLNRDSFFSDAFVASGNAEHDTAVSATVTRAVDSQAVRQ